MCFTFPLASELSNSGNDTGGNRQNVNGSAMGVSASTVNNVRQTEEASSILVQKTFHGMSQPKAIGTRLKEKLTMKWSEYQRNLASARNSVQILRDSDRENSDSSKKERMMLLCLLFE